MRLSALSDRICIFELQDRQGSLDSLDYIKEVRTDMRPLSLRKKMEEMEQHDLSHLSSLNATFERLHVVGRMSPLDGLTER